MGVVWNHTGPEFSRGFTEESKELPKTPAVPQAAVPTVPQSAPPAQPAAKVPQTRERGNDLVFEFYSGRKDLVVEERDCRISRAILVDHCTDCVVQVKAKVKNIVISECSKTGVVLTEVISGVEIINSKKVQVQSQGQVPSITIDSTEGAEIFLGGDAKDPEVFAVAKSVDMNASVADESNPDGQNWRSFISTSTRL
jgi:adenylyl cyclase-associated protein